MSSELVCDLPKSAKHMLVVEFSDLEIGRADERYSASMAEYLPSPCARSIAAAGLAHSMGSPAAMPLSTKSKGNATNKVISAIGHRFAFAGTTEWPWLKNLFWGVRPPQLAASFMTALTRGYGAQGLPGPSDHLRYHRRSRRRPTPTHAVRF